jgi:hypothetical protein
MNLLKKLWNFLFGSKGEPVVLEEAAAEELTVDHCNTHLRFRRHCPDCLRAVAAL